MPRVELRFHGRGGQGAVTAAKIVAAAAIMEGRYALAFPEYGAERRGAPVVAYTRIDEEPILEREPILEPDVVVVLDPSLDPKVYMSGLKSDGILVINTKKTLDQLSEYIGRAGFRPPRCIALVNATDIALKHLRAPIVNTAMLGSLIKAARVVSLDSVIEKVRETFGERPHVIEPNIRAIEEAYNSTQVICS
ncbi:2-oxoacid:acceptor oxidoreductase family protein [Hyperthermus butylicus]|uniref:pyruvate synthase n=1 Tax=Hyperthermus butylicus (strain DSM 5456 / JCM 9403 / PLM1-5) TaxID=415426 RepID=A2BKL2_HYPBU|nr:2-oxoacid:acceptor oxidoreductase family protein [Hyperthermus butylicus]ABM80523.1 pyruvate/ketoisovalerate oxidoreductase gamma subunit [Hyperthermus butylicus DSM 5456]